MHAGFPADGQPAAARPQELLYPNRVKGRRGPFWFEVYDYKIYADEVRAYHASDAPVRICSAPARTSKSYSTWKDKLPYVFPTQPRLSSLHWLVGPTYSPNKEFA